ncbi:MAG: radical SAM protein [Bryobacterales bacterium]|nr:radical SAM protein [Bryobacterales bacterium]
MVPSLSFDPMLHLTKLEKVTLEFTTRCNLKCTYCAVSRPWHEKEDLDLAVFPSLLEEFKALGVKRVQISGGGETTIVKNWDDYLVQFIDHGIEVSIITNLAKPLTARAVRALSLCAEINTSCDTVDAELYAAIRKGGDFAVFLHNIARIRALCLSEGRRIPYLIWNAVATDKTIGLMDQWVAMGIAVGVDHFQISELSKLDDLPDGFAVDSVGTLSPEKLAEAREAVERGRQMAQAAGKWFALLPTVDSALQGSGVVMRIRTVVEQQQGSKPVLSKALTVLESAPASGQGKTKNCVMPWTEAYLYASHQLGPCCMYRDEKPVPAGGFTEALNTPNLIAMRNGLLTGKLVYPCTICAMFPEVDVEQFQQRVKNRLEGILF